MELTHHPTERFLALVGNWGIKPTTTRRYLTPDEVGKLVDAVGRTAYPERNRLLVLMMYRHGLRVSEATGLRWLDIDLRCKSAVGLDADQRRNTPNIHVSPGSGICAD